MKDAIFQIAEKIKQGGKNVVFTGAGISTESGIPDYRSQGGIWDKFRPVYFDEFMSSKDSRDGILAPLGWNFIKGFVHRPDPMPHIWRSPDLKKWACFKPLSPRTSMACTRHPGWPDDKHHRAAWQYLPHPMHGLPQDLEPIGGVQQRLAAGDMAPECECGGFLKPDTISFGQAMPVAEDEKAAALSQNCDFFLVVGSTLLVQPAAHMPIYGKNGGAFLAIINLSDTPCDEMCDVLICGKAGEVLEQIVTEVEKSH